ncbi:MAG: hypothetical protein FVQ85_08965 [Planctomycetes bacterium]|nr:hypothetical protein [Planctomycetota bacterium]
MPKHKAGLHKEVSSIFTGIQVPKDRDADGQPNSKATDGSANYGPPSHLSGTTLKTKQPPKPPSEAFQPEKPKAVEKKAAKVQVTSAIEPGRPSVLDGALQLIKEKLFAPKPGVSPTRQKVMVVLVPVMFIFMVMALLKMSGSGPGETTAPKTFMPSNAIAASTATIDWKIPEPYPSTLRDPMRFGAAATTNTTDTIETKTLTVKGILYSEDDPSAIIGIEILHEGDIVSGATIVKINQDSVEFEMNGKKWTQKVQ